MSQSPWSMVITLTPTSPRTMRAAVASALPRSPLGYDAPLRGPAAVFWTGAKSLTAANVAAGGRAVRAVLPAPHGLQASVTRPLGTRPLPAPAIWTWSTLDSDMKCSVP